MEDNLKIEEEKDRGVIRISGSGLGVVFVVVKDQIKLKDAIPYEANDKGRCIGFEVAKDVDLEIFFTRIKKFAKENNIEIVE